MTRREGSGGGSERADWANKDTAGRKKEIFWTMQRGRLSRRRRMEGEVVKERIGGREMWR